MKLKKAYEAYKKFKVPSLSEIRDTASEHSKTSLVIIILLVVILLLVLQYIPHYQVAQFNITNQKDLADAENSYRATLAQILGGGVVAIGIYFAWRNLEVALATLESNQKKAREDIKLAQKTHIANQENAQKNLKLAQEGQITERFTRAVEQLGNPAIEVRVGGIHALQRISNESIRDYWSIIQILTSFIRQKSPHPRYIEIEDSDNKVCSKITSYEFFEYLNNKPESEIIASFVSHNARKLEVPMDIQAAVYVIKERRFFNAAFKDLKNPHSNANIEPDFLSLYGTDDSVPKSSDFFIS